MNKPDDVKPYTAGNQPAQCGASRRREVGGVLLDKTPANVRRIGKLREAMEETLIRALRRDFFGVGALEFTVQDGTIQEIRQRLERVTK
ncbi:MAG: hypothetical protein GXY58_04460 [Planctomycetaceae bacterium]|nr:hypothetical protein [Planctomycetaceae bacterium]